jgi:hypothetical protein
VRLLTIVLIRGGLIAGAIGPAMLAWAIGQWAAR